MGREVTTHLGEAARRTNERCRAEHKRKLLADICYRMGERFAAQTKKAFDLENDDPPLAAIEVLRMSEYNASSEIPWHDSFVSRPRLRRVVGGCPFVGRDRCPGQGRFSNSSRISLGMSVADGAACPRSNTKRRCTFSRSGRHLRRTWSRSVGSSCLLFMKRTSLRPTSPRFNRKRGTRISSSRSRRRTALSKRP